MPTPTVENFSTCTTGVAPTAACLNSSLTGPRGTGASNDGQCGDVTTSCIWNVQNGAGLTIQPPSASVCGPPPAYATGNIFDLSTSSASGVTSFIQFHGPPAPAQQSKQTVGVLLFCSNLPTTSASFGTTGDAIIVIGSGSQISNFNHVLNGGFSFTMECSGCTNNIPYTPGTWVQVSYMLDTTGNIARLRVYDTSGNQIGLEASVNANGATSVQHMFYGNGNPAVYSPGFHIQFMDITNNYLSATAADFPLLLSNSGLLSSGIIDTPRAMDWTQAGISGFNSGILPSATYTQCGTTLPAGTYNGSTIETTLAACPTNTFYLLGPGVFNISGPIHMPTAGNHVLRGSGANSTFINGLAGSACHGQISAVVCLNSADTHDNQNLGVVCNWTAGYAQGFNQITLTGCTGAGISAISTTNPTMLFLDQDSTGYTGNGLPTGSAVDNAQLYICSDQYNGAGPTGCSVNGFDSGGVRRNRDQVEVHTATAVNVGTGVVTLAQPLIMPNWTAGQNPQVWIMQPIVNTGIENLAMDMSDASAPTGCVDLENAYHWWISGVKCTQNKRTAVNVFQSAFGIIQNSYIYGSTGHLPSNYGLRFSLAFNNLIQNNIVQNIQGGSYFNDGSASGNVFAYNYSTFSRQSNNNFLVGAFTEHAGDYYDLFEGNAGGQLTCDVAHGTCDMVTAYRNFFTGWESQPSLPINSATNAIAHFNFNRYTHSVGNVLGTLGYHTGYTSVAGTHDVYNMGSGAGPTPNEGAPFLTRTTALFWGNYDVITAANRFCGNSSDTGWVANCASTSEVPIGASTFPNAVPTKGDTTIGQPIFPASFYTTTKPVYFGSIPWPPIGPDVSSGNVGQCAGPINTAGKFNGSPGTNASQCAGSVLNTAWAGHVNAIPAMNCALNIMGMPLDGTGPALPFDASVCYSSGSLPVPTLVQHASCSNSGTPAGVGSAQSGTPDYLCPLPELSQLGNAILVGVTAFNGGAAYTLSDDKSNAYTLVDSIVDSNGALVSIYLATNVIPGTRFIKLHSSNSTVKNVAMSVSEYYNVATSSAVDVHGCVANASSTTITSGSITPTTVGDLLWQWAVNASGGSELPASTTSFTAGSQSNITWQLNGTDIYNGSAVQAGVYGSTAAINPTLTSGTAQAFTSCTMALKPATAGNPPSQAFRIVHVLHQQVPSTRGGTWPMQFPTSGNLIVLSEVSAGSEISSISSSPANTWASTGAVAGGPSQGVASQIFYAAAASTSNSMTITPTLTGTGTNDTFMLYDIVGAAAIPLDKDSGGQTGNQGSITNSFTTCNNCIFPSLSNELIIGNAGWGFCTATGIISPPGSLFDAANYTGNSVDGPQAVDENSGWFHFYQPNNAHDTVTWAMNCGVNPESNWAGRVATFLSAGSAPFVSVPTFSPVAGSYQFAQIVTISDSTAGATICFTTDGSIPTANGSGTCTHGTTYTSPVLIPANRILQAIGSRFGFNDSLVGSAIYTIGAFPDGCWFLTNVGSGTLLTRQRFI